MQQAHDAESVCSSWQWQLSLRHTTIRQARGLREPEERCMAQEGFLQKAKSELRLDGQVGASGVKKAWL